MYPEGLAESYTCHPQLSLPTAYYRSPYWSALLRPQQPLNPSGPSPCLAHQPDRTAQERSPHRNTCRISKRKRHERVTCGTSYCPPRKRNIDFSVPVADTERVDARLDR